METQTINETEFEQAEELSEEIKESETSEILTDSEETTVLPENKEKDLSFLEQKEESEPNAPSKAYDQERLDALRKHEQIASEYKEFSELFPGVSLAELPDSVTESVRSGVPLSAAYALYRYRRELAESAAAEINEKNSTRSFALKRSDSSDSYFSPGEVREMSEAEVRANYSKIIDSMSHWN